MIGFSIARGTWHEPRRPSMMEPHPRLGVEGPHVGGPKLVPVANWHNNGYRAAPIARPERSTSCVCNAPPRSFARTLQGRDKRPFKDELPGNARTVFVRSRRIKRRRQREREERSAYEYLHNSAILYCSLYTYMFVLYFIFLLHTLHLVFSLFAFEEPCNFLPVCVRERERAKIAARSSRVALSSE